MTNVMGNVLCGERTEREIRRFGSRDLGPPRGEIVELCETGTVPETGSGIT